MLNQEHIFGEFALLSHNTRKANKRENNSFRYLKRASLFSFLALWSRAEKEQVQINSREWVGFMSVQGQSGGGASRWFFTAPYMIDGTGLNERALKPGNVPLSRKCLSPYRRCCLKSLAFCADDFFAFKASVMCTARTPVSPLTTNKE